MKIPRDTLIWILEFLRGQYNQRTKEPTGIRIEFTEAGRIIFSLVMDNTAFRVLTTPAKAEDPVEDLMGVFALAEEQVQKVIGSFKNANLDTARLEMGLELSFCGGVGGLRVRCPEMKSKWVDKSALPDPRPYFDRDLAMLFPNADPMLPKPGIEAIEIGILRPGVDIGPLSP